MIEFRQKDFSKSPKALYKAAKEVLKNKETRKVFNKKVSEGLKKGATPIAITSLGISTLNLVNNTKRRHQDKEFQTNQVEATKELTKAIEDYTENDKKVKKAARGYKKSVKDVADSSLNDPATVIFRGK